MAGSAAARLRPGPGSRTVASRSRRKRGSWPCRQGSNWRPNESGCEELIAVAWIARNVVAQPFGRLEILRGMFVAELHLGHNESFVFLVVNIDLDDEIAVWNLVTRFYQALAFRRRPEGVELPGG